MRKNDELTEQRRLFNWALYCSNVPELQTLLWATPNGMRTDIKTAKDAKASGTKRGVPDVFLAVPRQAKHGFFIEMKSATGRLTPEQKDLIELLQGQGYRVDVHRSAESAARSLLEYLSAKESEIVRQLEKFIPPVRSIQK